MIRYELHSYTGEGDTVYNIARIDENKPDDWEYVRGYRASKMRQRNWQWLVALVARANRMAQRGQR